MAQMLSLLVDRVRDLRIGLRPRRVEPMRRADLMVPRRWWVRFSSRGSRRPWLRRPSVLPLGVRREDDADESIVVDIDGARRPLETLPFVCRFVVELAAESPGDCAVDEAAFELGGARDVGIVDGKDSTLSGCGGLRTLPARFRLRTLPARAIGAEPVLPVAAAAAAFASTSSSSSSDTQRSHRIQPRKVPKLLQLTTDTWDTRTLYMALKQTMKMVTAQTCCNMTVESATSGQKSYGLRRGFRWRFSRNVTWSV